MSEHAQISPSDKQKDPIMTVPDTASTAAHAQTEVSLPAPKSSGVSVGLVIALVIAALGIGFALGSLR